MEESSVTGEGILGPQALLLSLCFLDAMMGSFALPPTPAMMRCLIQAQKQSVKLSMARDL